MVCHGSPIQVCPPEITLTKKAKTMLRLGVLIGLLFGSAICAQGVSVDGYEFEWDISIPCTSVKNQAKTNTCWCFSTNSFLEAELVRCGKGMVDLSEMFVVRNSYPLKADRFVRLHGNGRFAGGGLFGDVLHVLRNYGAVPESVYSGRKNNSDPHNHEEMDAVLHAVLKTIVERKPPHNPAWHGAVHGILDAYLGAVPSEFSYEEQQYTPKSFADHLGLDPDDYIQFTSYSHHPYYREFALEVPDNWAGNRYWNVPLDELLVIMRQALQDGYSVAWDGDISERVCDRRRGIAVWPAISWDDMTTAQRMDLFRSPQVEARITPEYRQRRFDAHSSTDDHLMHIIGMSHDRTGAPYFVVKDSYGSRSGDEGFVHMSEAYMRCQTVAILVHKKGVPRETAVRIGLISEPALQP